MKLVESQIVHAIMEGGGLVLRSDLSCVCVTVCHCGGRGWHVVLWSDLSCVCDSMPLWKEGLVL